MLQEMFDHKKFEEAKGDRYEKYFHFIDMPYVPYIFPFVSVFSFEFLTRLLYGSNISIA